MSKLSKIIVTILAIVAYFIFIMILTGISERSGRRPSGLLATALLFGLIAGISAIWRKEDKGKEIKSYNEKENDSNSILQK